MALTIGELMSVDGGRQYKAQFCTVNLVKVYHEIKKESLPEKIKAFFLGKSHINTYYLIFKLQVTSDTGKTHTVFIRTEPSYNSFNVLGNRIQIYCDCSDFKFRAAYVLNKKKALFANDRIKIELGAALSVKPKAKHSTTYLCKHAYSAVQWLASNYSSVLKTL